MIIHNQGKPKENYIYIFIDSILKMSSVHATVV